MRKKKKAKRVEEGAGTSCTKDEEYEEGEEGSDGGAGPRSMGVNGPKAT